MQHKETTAGKTPRASRFSLEDRFNFGTFRITEAAELANVSRSKLYVDARAGLIKIRKRGSRSDIFGPDLRAYILREGA